MEQILRAAAYAKVADGTEVAELLNATRGPAIGSNLSIATGRLAAGVCSAVHFHPLVTQITYVQTGRLSLWMREPNAAKPYQVTAEPGNAAVTQPGTLLQLRNDSQVPTSVLYLVTPGYLRELDAAGQVLFDDAVIAGPSWDSLARTQLEPRALRAFTLQRAELHARLYKA
jgi:mannose-6-phosphate isomerase-like protein (cupin superfamily)